MRVMVTGCASQLAKVLLPRLFRETLIDEVIGIDLRPSHISHDKYSEQQMDIRAPEILKLLNDVDAVIHLAFVVISEQLGKERNNRELIRDINVNGSIHVFESAHQAGVNTLLYMSSAVVYGLFADNPAYMNEQHPLRAVPGFAYAEDKVAVDQWIQEFSAKNPQIRTLWFRPHIIIGSDAQPLLLKTLHTPVFLSQKDPQPLTQLIWEEDVVDAIMLGLLGKARGCFNLAVDSVISFRNIQQYLHPRCLPIPYALARSIHALAWKFTGRYAEPQWLEAMRFSLSIDNEKAKQELNWHPSLDMLECLDIIK